VISEISFPLTLIQPATKTKSHTDAIQFCSELMLLVPPMKSNLL